MPRVVGARGQDILDGLPLAIRNTNLFRAVADATGEQMDALLGRLPGDEPLPNLVKNPQFDATPYDFDWQAGASTAFAQAPSILRPTGNALRVTPTTLGVVSLPTYGLSSAGSPERIQVTPGKSYRAAIFHRYTAGAPADPRTLLWMFPQHDIAGAALANAFPTATSGGIISGTTTRLVSSIYTPAANVVSFRVVPHINADGTNEPIDFEGLMVVEGTPAQLATMPSYADGDSAGWRWTGTPHESFSEPAPGAMETLASGVFPISANSDMLAIYEAMIGIAVKPNLSLEQRRSIVQVYLALMMHDGSETDWVRIMSLFFPAGWTYQKTAPYTMHVDVPIASTTLEAQIVGDLLTRSLPVIMSHVTVSFSDTLELDDPTSGLLDKGLLS